MMRLTETDGLSSPVRHDFAAFSAEIGASERRFHELMDSTPFSAVKATTYHFHTVAAQGWNTKEHATDALSRVW